MLRKAALRKRKNGANEPKLLYGGNGGRRGRGNNDETMMTLMPPQRKGGAADGMGGADDNNDKTRQRGRGDETIQHKADAGEALKDGRIAEGRQRRR